MQQAIDIANKNADKARLLNKTTYDRKLYGNDPNVGDGLLLRNNSGRSGTSKLRSHWEDIIEIATQKADNIPVYDIKPKHCNDVKTKRVHRKIIMPCNLLPGNECKKEYIYKKPQPFSDKLDQSHPVEESDSDSDIVIAYPKEVCPKALEHSKKSDFHHSNIKRKGSDSSNNISQPLSTTDQKKSGNDVHHEFFSRRSTRVRAKRKIFTYHQLGKNPSLI